MGTKSKQTVSITSTVEEQKEEQDKGVSPSLHSVFFALYRTEENNL
jgi:hypothetical protein